MIDLSTLFAIDKSPLEMFLRGTVMYLSLFALLRIVPTRMTGSLGVPDLLMIVLLADASQNGMAGEYHSVTDGLILVVTIIGWSYTLNVLGDHFPPLERVIYGAPILLVKDGQPIWRNMRRQLLTLPELQSQLRLEGIDDLGDVYRAYVEPDGRVSVTEKERKEDKPRSPEPKKP
jgi:uncharacterized membrane protein YcaP (DUF421 family)